ncbi:hypothetical protein, partial [Pseudoalteromonas ruthenica]|uniref:hypothetical protein n=1 Tax=Pseudoalteromonas ruthenica TaxID=151081 RepID=UPI001BB1D441
MQFNVYQAVAACAIPLVLAGCSGGSDDGKSNADSGIAGKVGVTQKYSVTTRVSGEGRIEPRSLQLLSNQTGSFEHT